MKRYLTLLIIVVILAITAILLIKIYPASTKTPVVDTDSVTNGEVVSYNNGEWLGIYFQGKKVGYSFTRISENPQGYRFENRTKMSMIVANELREIKMVARVNTNKDYQITDYYMNMMTFGHAIKTSGKVQGKKLQVTINSQGITRTQEIELDSAPYFHEALDVLIKKKNLKVGDSLSIPFFDIATQTPSRAIVRVIGEERISIDGKEWLARKVSVDVLGMTSYFWLDVDGRFLKESSPMGIDMLREDRQKALESVKPEELIDILTFFAVKLDVTIPNPRATKYVKLQVENLDTIDLDLRGDYQNVVSINPLIIECVSPELNELSDHITPGQNEKDFLKPTIYIQCEEPEIINTAKKIAGDSSSQKEIVRQLTGWVYKNLKKQPTVSMPSAIDVLKTKEGDCNEHAILFTALARALGIPTKIYVGLVNLGDAYYYHAWCSVYLGKWVPVDPTFGEFPADAGHLKLKEGEISEQTKVLKVVGKLKIKLLAYK